MESEQTVRPLVHSSHSNTSFIPFPDLTGWRSQCEEPKRSSSKVTVSQRTSITLEKLKEASKKLNRSDVEDIITAAWVIILTHFSSQDGDIEINYYGHDQSHVNLAIRRAEQTRISLEQLLYRIKNGRNVARGRSAIKADNRISIDLTSKTITRDNRDEVPLLFFVTLDEDEIVCLSLSASAAIHNHSSASMHLKQVLCCFEQLCKMSSDQPALSLHYFPKEYLAGDNAHPKPIHDDIGIGGLISERLEYQTQRVAVANPDAMALDFRSTLESPAGEEAAGNYLWTYKELVRRASVIAEIIKKTIEKHNEKVDYCEIIALCLEKSPYTYISILAVLLSGAAWCPIDTDWPFARRQALLDKSGAKIVLTAGDEVSAGLEGLKKPANMIVIRLDNLDYNPRSKIVNGESTFLPSSEALAYLIWTSGTTGLPKAVGIQHKAAVQALRALQRIIPHDDNHIRYLQFSAYNFDLMILDMFYTWGLGGTLCSGTRSLLLTKLIPLSNKLKITHTLLTPAILAMIPRESISSLQVVINGGEKLSQVVADVWSVNCCLLNLYGPAEATLIAMHRKISQGDHVKAPNIGRALPTTSCHAIDADGKIILKGAIGELVLGGYQCALGYIGEASKTREVFIEHELLGRVYKTGDLVRQLWNGDFEYLGRRDDQIKVNGIRIELLEINTVIRKSSARVKDSETLVVYRHENKMDAEIINFSVIPPSLPPSSSSSHFKQVKSDEDFFIRNDEEAVDLARNLIVSARASLPSYMIPSLFIIVNNFPRTSSAKIDRQELKLKLANFDRNSWLKRLSSNVEDDEDEESDVEKIIRKQICHLCNLSDDSFDRHTAFPSLGLNSIKAITLSQRLQQDNVIVSVVDLVQFQTLAQLSRELHQRGAGGVIAGRGEEIARHLEQYEQKYRAAVQNYLKTSLESIERVQPVTDMQEALLLESIRDKSRYWLHREYALPLEIDIIRLKKAISIVVQETEILRTSFLHCSSLGIKNGNGMKTEFISVVLSDHPLQLVEKSENEKDWNEDVALDMLSLFQLEVIGKQPPVAFLLIKGRSNRLMTLLHHSIYDQTTLLAFERAISRCYYDAASFKPLSLLPFSSALRMLIDRSEQERQKRLEVWQNLLGHHPMGHSISIPDMSDWSHNKQQVRSRDELYRCNRKLLMTYEIVASAAKKMKTSVRPILQAAWSTVLSNHCDTDYILIGDSISSRAAFVEAKDVAGPVLDTVPVPIVLAGSYRDVIVNIEKYHRKAIANLPVPICNIRQMLQFPNDLPLFSTIFLFEMPEDEGEGDDNTGRSNILKDKRDFNLSVEHAIAVEVNVEPNGGVIELNLLAKHSDVSMSSAELLLSQWESALTMAVEEPDRDIFTISDKPQEESIFAISSVVTPESLKLARSRHVSSCLSKYSQETPIATAIEFYHSLDLDALPSTLTYQELHSSTESIAKILLNTIKPRSVVAVSLYRSINTYICLLAIWKAGMVYLPIDFTLPRTRKQSLLEESKASCLIWSKEASFEIDDNCELPILDADLLIWLDAPSNTLLPMIDMSSPAYIIFTSGSTGKPKGCVLSHENLSCTIEAFLLTINSHSDESLDKSTRFFARSLEAFDVALLEALLPLQVGGSIVTGSREVILRDIGKAMQHMQVTHAAVVPSLFYTSGRNGGKRRRVIPNDVPNLRVLIVGGEKIAQDIIDKWGPSHIPLLNAYGPTETCIGNSIARLFLDDSTRNIGTPFPGTQYIVMRKKENDYEAILRGQSGELCIAGLQVGSYLEQQGQKSPFIDWKGKRVYRTGDEVRMRSDDTIEYLGRIDGDQSSNQVKLRGIRIELSEIDSALQSQANQLRFILTRLIGEPSHLIAFASSNAATMEEDIDIRPSEDEALQNESKELMRVAKEKLPNSMMPRHMITIEKFPLISLSGKLDVKRIEKWYLSNYQTLNKVDEKKAKREMTETEVIVKEEVERLIEVSISILPQTDLFSLGMDSFNVMSLAYALIKRDIDVDMGFIMMHPTIEEVAKGRRNLVMSNRKGRNDYLQRGKAMSEKTGLRVKKVYPLLPLQESMVTQTLTDYAAGQIPRYINTLTLEIKMNTVKTEKLKRCIDETLGNHEIYQTIFVESRGKLLQCVLGHQVSLQIEGTANFYQKAVESICVDLDTTPPLRYCIGEFGEVNFALHHAIYDGDSLSAFLNEVEQRYREEEVSLGIPFSDYVAEIDGIDMDTKLNYWQYTLETASVAQFPCLTGKKNIKSNRRRSIGQLASNSLNILKSKARKTKKTLQLHLLEIFTQLYDQYTGEKQSIIGLVLGGRTETQNSVHGPCINTVAFAHNRTKSIQMEFAEALQNQHISLTSLSIRLQVGGIQLFNALFSYLGAEKDSNFFKEISSSLITEYPFALEVTENRFNDTLKLQLIFNPDLLPKEQANLFLLQFDSLLNSQIISETADCSIMAVENEFPQLPTADSLFLRQFEKNVDEIPEAIAFTFYADLNKEREQMTYKQLDEISDKMTKQLCRIQGDYIGILLKQSPSLYSLMIAVWKAGKAYIPLDPNFPLDRLQYMVSISKPAIIVSSINDLSIADRLGRSISIEALLKEFSFDKVDHDLSITYSLELPAYIMFTSGSSGKPKGVQISHRALAAAIMSWKQILPYKKETSRMLQLASPGFDVFLIEFCMPLSLGFSFASAPKEVLLENLEFSFDKLDITMADLPAVLASTVHSDGIANIDKLEWLMSGGDQINDAVIQHWSKNGLVNAWGPTETTIGNTLGFVTTNSSRHWVGKVYPTSSIYIIDPESNKILFRGCMGEIAVGGPQLADGYIGNLALTRENFIHLESNGERVYKTGDRGRILNDGSVECLGRIDLGQVKINSQRVELKEIEAQLEKHDSIADTCVLYIQHKEIKTKQLVAFWIVKGQMEEDGLMFQSDVNNHIREYIASALNEASKYLAPYMIPSLCFVMAKGKFPLTPNDKVDTKRLEEAFTSLTIQEIRQLEAQEKVQSNNSKPWTELQRKLQSCVAKFCQVEEVEVDQDVSFYRLGIDSISCYRLAKKLSKDVTANITVRDILSNPNIAALSVYIERDYKPEKSAPANYEHLKSRYDTRPWQRSELDKITAVLPCTPIQEGMLLETIVKGLYTNHNVFIAKSDELDMIIEAINGMTEDIDILRTTFHLVDDHFIQAIHSIGGVEIIDLGEANSKEEAKKVLQYRTVLTEENNLAEAPLAIQFIKLQDQHYLLDIVLHHALYDGESLEMIFTELEHRVKGGVNKRGRQSFKQILPHLLSQKSDEEYFVNRLQDAWKTRLKRCNSSSTQTCVSSQRKLKVSIEELSKAAANINVTVPIVALYSFGKLLSNLCGQRDVIFAQLFSLRDAIKDVEMILGPVFNSVISRVAILSNESQRNTLTRLQKENDTGRIHRTASIAEVLRLLQRKRGGDKLDFDALFDYQRVISSVQVEERILRRVELEEIIRTQYGLNVQFQQSRDGLSIFAVANSDCFTTKELDSHIDTLEQIMEMAVGDMNLPSTCMPKGMITNIDTIPDKFRDGIVMERESQASPNGYGLESSQELDEKQKIIVEVISEVTGVGKDSIDILASITRFGLDSILSIKLASNLRRRGMNIGVADIIRGKTIKGISDKLREKELSNRQDRIYQSIDINHSFHSEQLCYFKEEEVEAVLPLLPGQLFELSEYCHKKGKSEVYTFLFKLKEDSIDKVRMKKAWSDLIHQEGVLRTGFVEIEESPRQIIFRKCKETSWQSRRIKGKITSLFEDAKITLNWLQDACPIDNLLREPPVAACLVHADDGTFLVLRLHHVLYDAEAIDLLMQELLSLYHNESQDHVSYIDLIRHIQKEKQEMLEDSRQYWKALLDSVSPSIVGNNMSGAATSPITSISFSSLLLGQATKFDEKLRRQGGSNLATVFVAAWAHCLAANLSGNRDIVVFGLYRRGRSSAFSGVERAIGNYMNILPLIADISNSENILQNSLEVKRQIEEQIPYESFTSIRDILQWTNSKEPIWNTYLNLLWEDSSILERGESRYQLVDTSSLLDYQISNEGATSDFEDVWSEINRRNMKAEVNVNVHWNRKRDCIDVVLKYRSDLLTKEQADEYITGMIQYVHKATS